MSRLVRVPAVDAVGLQRVVHLYEPLRPGQLRGLPALTQVLIKLRDLDAYDDATLVRVGLANLFAMFVTRAPGDGAAAVDPLTGQGFDYDAEGRPMIPLEPGLVQELAPGEDVKFSEPPDPSGYSDFVGAQLQAVAIGAGLPYEVMTEIYGASTTARSASFSTSFAARSNETAGHHFVPVQPTDLGDLVLVRRHLGRAHGAGQRLGQPRAVAGGGSGCRRRFSTSSRCRTMRPSASRSAAGSSRGRRWQRSAATTWINSTPRSPRTTRGRTAWASSSIPMAASRPQEWGGSPAPLPPGVKVVKEVTRDAKTRLITGVTERHVQEGQR